MSDNIMPITRAQALSGGHTLKQLRGPGFQRLFRGVYLPAGTSVTTLQRARGALLASPAGSYVSHHTAALLWGAVPPESAQTHISVPDGSTRSVRDGIFAHRAETTYPPTERRGLRISVPVAVFLELASQHLDLVALVVLGDSLVRRAKITPPTLVAATAQWTGKGARFARRAAGLVRAGVDSAMESRLRVMIVLAGLPEPDVNFIIRDALGDWRIRFDLCYPQLKLIIEYDGKHHRLDAAQWRRDLLRREQLEREGWRLIVITSDAFYDHPEETLTRIRQALVDRGATGLPRRTPPGWYRYFGTDGA